MKIKFLSLLLILAGIIMISGCVDKEAQVFTCKAPGDLYRTIFYPYIGLLSCGEPEMSGMHTREAPPDGFHPGHESMHALRYATTLLDRNIEKAEVISLRLEAGIERYKAEGEDVSRLEARLEEYNLLVKEAKQYRALADAAAGEENNSSVTSSDSYNCSSEDIEREYLIRSQKSMIQANHVLRDIFEELQLLMPGTEELNNTSRLSAAGEGRAILMGSFTLNLHMEEGEMAIVDLSRDSEIDIRGDYTFEEKNDRHGKVRLYHIKSADVKVSGSRKTVLLSNEKITLTADGEGYVAFMGNGTYSVEEAGETVKEENWGKPFFGEGVGHGEQGPDGKEDNIGYGPEGKDNDMVIGNRSGNNTTGTDRDYPETESRRNSIPENT